MQTLTHPARAAGDFLFRLRSRQGAARARARAASAGPAVLTCALARCELRELGDFHGGTVECIAGCVWLTHDGDPRDVLLQAGQSHLADRRSRLLVSAQEASTIRLLPPAK